jgi:hypothetical protein
LLCRPGFAGQAEHGSIIQDAQKYTSEHEKCKLLHQSVDPNDLYKTHTPFDILDITMARKNSQNGLTEAEKIELLEKHQPAIDEANYIRKFGKFKNPFIWVDGSQDS